VASFLAGKRHLPKHTIELHELIVSDGAARIRLDRRR
jgi:hypothetical protein